MSNLNPLHFDNSVFDIYGSMFNSATLVPVEKNEILIPKNLQHLSIKNFTEYCFSVAITKSSGFLCCKIFQHIST